MIRPLIPVLLVALALPVNAQDDLNDYSKSLLYKDRSNPYGEMNQGTTDQEEQDAHCADLMRQMQDLKGKPQRLAAVSRRFNAECKTRNGPRERSSLKESNRISDMP
jgi:hypothetical protein